MEKLIQKESLRLVYSVDIFDMEKTTEEAEKRGYTELRDWVDSHTEEEFREMALEAADLSDRLLFYDAEAKEDVSPIERNSDIEVQLEEARLKHHPSRSDVIIFEPSLPGKTITNLWVVDPEELDGKMWKAPKGPIQELEITSPDDVDEVVASYWDVVSEVDNVEQISSEMEILYQGEIDEGSIYEF